MNNDQENLLQQFLRVEKLVDRINRKDGYAVKAGVIYKRGVIGLVPHLKATITNLERIASSNG
jgi:hypothetical protein